MILISQTFGDKFQYFHQAALVLHSKKLLWYVAPSVPFSFEWLASGSVRRPTGNKGIWLRQTQPIGFEMNGNIRATIFYRNSFLNTSKNHNFIFISHPNSSCTATFMSKISKEPDDINMGYVFDAMRVVPSTNRTEQAHALRYMDVLHILTAAMWCCHFYPNIRCQFRFSRIIIAISHETEISRECVFCFFLLIFSLNESFPSGNQERSAEKKNVIQFNWSQRVSSRRCKKQKYSLERLVQSNTEIKYNNKISGRECEAECVCVFNTGSARFHVCLDRRRWWSWTRRMSSWT